MGKCSGGAYGQSSSAFPGSPESGLLMGVPFRGTHSASVCGSCAAAGWLSSGTAGLAGGGDVDIGGGAERVCAGHGLLSAAAGPGGSASAPSAALPGACSWSAAPTSVPSSAPG